MRNKNRYFIEARLKGAVGRLVDSCLWEIVSLAGAIEFLVYRLCLLRLRLAALEILDNE